MITGTDDDILQLDIKLKETTQELDLTKERFQKKIVKITTYYETLILQKEHKHQSDCDELKEVINEQQAATSVEKTVALNNYFSSVFTEETKENMPEAVLNHCRISPQTVKEKILKLNENKSPDQTLYTHSLLKKTCKFSL